jgi:dTDP-4-dehydrorhamnose 3,5-epimerase
MEFAKEILPGVHRLGLKRLADARGDFVKTFSRSVYGAAGVSFDFAEEYYSTSHKDVIRGMHFQIPPHDHGKIVYCAVGAVRDVLLDLRKGPGYGKAVSLVLSADAPELLVIAKGVAHGFAALQDNSLMVYKTNTEYAPQHDRGIRWDSFGFDWKVSNPLLSDRDKLHPPFAEFASPF